MQKDIIYRQAAIEALAKFIRDPNHNYYFFNATSIESSQEHARMILGELPSAQPEQHKGHWIGGDGSYICSECNGSPMDFIDTMGASFDIYVETPMNYCPNCGADMRGGDE